MRNLFKLVAVSAFVLSTGISAAALAETTGQYVDDATITTKVKTALVADPATKATQVSVDTNQGAVQLSGTVDSKKEESEAIRVANQVTGVKSVKDMMTVKGAQ